MCTSKLELIISKSNIYLFQRHSTLSDACIHSFSFSFNTSLFIQPHYVRILFILKYFLNYLFLSVTQTCLIRFLSDKLTIFNFTFYDLQQINQLCVKKNIHDFPFLFQKSQIKLHEVFLFRVKPHTCFSEEKGSQFTLRISQFHSRRN